MTDHVTTTDTAKQPGVVHFIGIDWDFGALRRASRAYWLWVGVLGVFLALGILSWTQLITKGGTVLGMRDYYPWGLWFVNYMYYVGLAAGGFVVYAAVHLFAAERFRPLSRLAVLLAGTFVMMALLGIITDMERPWRMIWFALTPNPTSPFLFTGSAAGAYMVICFIDLWILISGKGGEKLAFRMTLIALPLAIYLHTTTAFVLVMNKSRELWNTAVLVPIFLTSATASGIAALFIFLYLVQWLTPIKFEKRMFRSLATLLATVIIIDLFLLVVEILVTFWPTSSQPGHALRLGEFLWGQYAWAFLPVLLLGTTAFILLAWRPTRHKPAVQVTASILYVIAIYLKRYSLMAMGFTIDTLGQQHGIYVPSLVEVFLALGILSLGLLLITAALKVLPMEVPADEHGHEEPEWMREMDEEDAPAAVEPVYEPAYEQGYEQLPADQGYDAQDWIGHDESWTHEPPAAEGGVTSL